jgi:asparagine synthase (glutamine-hydrolysing)
MEEAVRLQLRSDVPVAALLSGGLDSSSVVALMAGELGPGVKTFSVGFGRDDDELPYAQEVARRFETEHHELMVTDDAATQAAEALGAYSEPFGDSSSVPTVAVCREVARHVKVVLTGDGGDELFAGYGRYRQVESLPHLKGARAALPLLADAVPRARSLRRAAQAVDAAGGERYRALLEVFSAAEREALLGGPTEPAPYVDLPGSADAAMAFDLGVYLPDDLLVKVDIASMHSSLESRAPFLDPRIGEWVIPFPASAKQDRDVGKRMLKAAMEDLLPPAILHRAKRGFGSPVEQWLQGPLRPLMEDLLAAPSAKVRDLLDSGEVDRVVEGARTGRGNAHQAWALLALESWLRGTVR